MEKKRSCPLLGAARGTAMSAETVEPRGAQATPGTLPAETQDSSHK